LVSDLRFAPYHAFMTEESRNSRGDRSLPNTGISAHLYNTIDEFRYLAGDLAASALD